MLFLLVSLVAHVLFTIYLQVAIKCLLVLSSVFLGYSHVQKGYRCFSPSTHRFYTSANVTFFEDIPYFANSDVPPVELDQVLPIPYFESVESIPSPSSDPPAVVDTSSPTNSPPPINWYGITYERRVEPHASIPIPSVSSPTPE